MTDDINQIATDLASIGLSVFGFDENGPFPVYPEACDDFQINSTIYTRDGAKIGNGFIYDTGETPDNGIVYAVETDFGNKALFTRREMEELFTPGLRGSHEDWRQRRQQLFYSNLTLVEELQMVMTKFDATLYAHPAIPAPNGGTVMEVVFNKVIQNDDAAISKSDK